MQKKRVSVRACSREPRGASHKARMPQLFCDLLYCTALTGKALMQDDFSLCFKQEAYEAKTQLTFKYALSVVVRYGVLLPCRMLSVVLVIVACTFLLVLLRVLCLGALSGWLVMAGCRALLWCMGIQVQHHGEKPLLKDSHVFVANHTTYIDYIVLSSHKFSHSVLAQKHAGIMPMLLKLTSGAIQFERNTKTSRQSVREQIRKLLPSTHLLMFPEGTCVNNEYTVMFQKGAFDLNIPVCPVAIKYNKENGDPYWNTKKQTFLKHFIYLITRWRIGVSVWWIPPMKIERNETSPEFAARVKKQISEQAGLKNLAWNGYLKHCTTPEEMKEMKLHEDKTNLGVLPIPNRK
ncbi:glycerol-3-phosphate O-acyltransferase 3/4 [Nematocida sp. AWRm77]|nr:glycerol-3-phosphate O-acyltransferase 3/4 [Nematocida sp. AWRm77]